MSLFAQTKQLTLEAAMSGGNLRISYPNINLEALDQDTSMPYEKILTDNGAEIVNEETWGLKKMAYAIQKKSTGFYCLLEFKGEPTIVEKLETGFRRDEKVIRYITVKEDKHMVAYAEKRRAKLGKKEEA